MFEGQSIKERLRAWSRQLPGSRWYVVGGAVRDAMLGRPLRDFDVMVAGVESEALSTFLAARGEIDFVGRVFGVFKFIPKEGGRAIDIALPRHERAFGTGGYRDAIARPDPAMPVEEDLARRDFTINAMAWLAEDETVVDPFGGREDLGRKTLRAVGNPAERFAEDYTRMLRALRFAAELGFAIEPETWNALQALMPRVNAVHGHGDGRAGERLVPHELIARELLRSLAGDPKRAARLWRESGAFVATFVHDAIGPEQERRLAFIGAGHAEACLAALLYDHGALHAAAEAERLRSAAVPDFDASADHLATVIGLAARMRAKPAEAWRPSALRQALFGRGTIARDALLLADALGVRTEAFERRLGDIRARAALPLLNGREIMRVLKLDAGPRVREAIDLLIDAQAEGMIADPAQAEEWLITHWQRDALRRPLRRARHQRQKP